MTKTYQMLSLMLSRMAGLPEVCLIPVLFINSAIGIERFLNCFLVVMNLSKICILRPGYICPDLALKTFNTRLVLAHCF